MTPLPVGWVKPTRLHSVSETETKTRCGFHPPYSLLVNISLAIFLFLAGALYALPTMAEVLNQKTKESKLAPVYEISNPKVSQFASAIGYVFSLSDTDKYFSEKMSEVNFIFISKPLAIVSGKINLSNLNMFQGEAKLDLAKFNSDSDECFVQPIVMEDQQKIILAINSSENGSEDIDKKCFLLRLAFFDNYSIN